MNCIREAILMVYDKTLFIDNVYYLAKDRRIRIGELESRCHVSAGYFSRLRQMEKNIAPGVDFLMALADALNVSMDSLLTFDYTGATETEQNLHLYMEKLIRETKARKLIWQEDVLAYPDTMPLNPDGSSMHSLYRDESYFSPFHPEMTGLILTKAYFCSILGDRSLYLVQVCGPGSAPSHPEEWTELELIMLEALKDPLPFCHTNHSKPSRLDADLNRLFALMEDSASLPNLSSRALQVIHAYLNETEK